MGAITELEQRIRDYINAPRKHSALFEDRIEFSKLCSCLDVIGDTELAFSAYESMADSTPPGSTYILAYGFLQALFLQQNAVCNLYEALGEPYASAPLLREIREIRNDASGHPTKRGGGRGRSFNFISRMSIRKSGFQLMTITPGQQSPRFRDVSFQALLDTQHQQLEQALRRLLDSLRKEEMEHRERFRADKFVELFPGILHYYFEKVYQSTRSPNSWEYGAMHVKLISEVVEKFKAELTRREIAGAHQGVEGELELLEYPLTQLADFFTQQGKGRLNERDAEIFTSYVESGMSELKTMAACTAPGSLDTHLCYAAWRSSYSSRASIGV